MPVPPPPSDTIGFAPKRISAEIVHARIIKMHVAHPCGVVPSLGNALRCMLPFEDFKKREIDILKHPYNKAL